MAQVTTRNRNKDKFDKEGKPKKANWEYRFEAAKINGKRKHISKSGFRTKKEAELAGIKALSEYNNAGMTFEPSEMSFSDYLDYWFENYVKISCSYNTQTAYSVIINNHLKPSLGAYKLRSLTPMILQEYVNGMYKNGYKKSTLKNIMGVMSGSLKYAVVPSQLLQSSPAEYISYPKVKSTRSDTNRSVISVEDFNRMIERFEKGNPFRYALFIGFYTGLRIGEVFGLTWNDIDFDNKTLSVNKQIVKREKAWYFGEPKTPASVRTIQIGDTLIEELKEYKRIQAENELKYGEFYTKTYIKEEKDEKGKSIHRIVEAEKSLPLSLVQVKLIMRKADGTYSSTDSFKYASRVIHYELGIKFNFHSLRHTHATKLIENGVSPKAVQVRLGHDKIETTLQTYTHNTKAMEEGAVDTFERLVDKK